MSHPPRAGNPRDARLAHSGFSDDYLLVPRGAERTFAQMALCWPEAPIYTLLYDERVTHGEFAGRMAAACIFNVFRSGSEASGCCYPRCRTLPRR
jgi:hypothetical protein